MYDKLIFSKAGTENNFCFKYSDKYLEAIEYCEDNSILGNVYVGVIIDYVSNLNAAFVNFNSNGEQRGYLSLSDGPLIYLNPKNSDKPCRGDKVLVQVSTDRIKSKDFTLTCNINLHGRYLILTKTANRISVSKKIKNPSARQLMKNTLDKYTDTCGFIVRTNGVNASEEDLLRDADKLITLYDSVYNRAITSHIGECVHLTSSDYSRITLENLIKGTKKIYTDSAEIYGTISQTLKDNDYFDDVKSGDITLKLYRDHNELNLLFGIEHELEKSLSKKVWLKSGAYLVIENTEALNVIDINTGKVLKSGDKEKSFLKINLEAADVVMREIKKRNLTGIIIVDFINMNSEEAKAALLLELKRLAQMDEINTNIVGFTNLGLVEITRKRNKKPLTELMM